MERGYASGSIFAVEKNELKRLLQCVIVLKGLDEAKTKKDSRQYSVSSSCGLAKREVDRMWMYLAATCGWCAAPKTAPTQRSSELTFSTVFIPLKLDNSIWSILQY
jgi:hypothetical protein